ncbi:hypothetical protein GCM10011506_09340 [Marivirga lumbricoides]|uniref:Response regulatory domain-containing protein n=1 Tax=Marivirga lumbricoides TaxID=1046115 RepID=A0ABQ1LL57_9BACT|nr:hypothetical protein GCM10011506_09340 [Marivirga lumbricoides]
MRKIILLADDDFDDAEIFSEALQNVKSSAEFIHFETGQAAFDYLKSSKAEALPECIFLDINMPVLNGWQTLSKIKNSEGFNNIPVIMYTTSSSSSEKKIALDLGAEAFITKPTDISDLMKILKEVLAANYKDL